MKEEGLKKSGKKALILIVCILINLTGKWFAARFHFPVWLDMTGTCIASYFLGIAGGIVAALANNLLFGLLDSTSFAYAVTGVIVAAVVGICIKKGYFEEWTKAAVSSFWIGILSLVVSTPINLLLYDGYSGNMWGNALFDMLEWQGVPLVFCAIAGEAVVEIVDKQVGVLLAYAIIHMVLRRKNRKNGAALIAAAYIAAVLLQALLPAGTAYAKEDTDGISDNFTAKIYNNSAGMMSSEANVIEETEDGYIWIGSYAGLTRYDGKEFEFIREGGIASVTCLMTDSRGRLWIGTNDSGIARYENGEFTFFTMEDGLPANSIRSFAEMGNGCVYAGTTDRICRIDDTDQIEVVSQEFTYVISMESCNGVLVGVDNNGAIFALKEDGTLAKQDKELSSLFCNCIEKTSGGLLLGTSNQDVYRLEADETGIRIAGRITADITDIISIEEDKEGRIWVCAEAGLGFFDKNGHFEERYYQNFDSSLEWIHVDYQGNIWVASSRYGVLKLSRSQFVDLFDRADIPDAVVNAVVFYRGDYYCGTDNGLLILDGKSGRKKENGLTNLLKDTRIRCLMTDSEGRLWICSYRDDYGLICYDETDTAKVYNVAKNQMTSDRARCAAELPDGTIAVGTADGINFIDGEKVVGTITTKDGLDNAQILSLAVGEDGTLYAGSDGGGLYAVSNRKIVRKYTTEDGLSSNVILRVVPHDGGYLIVTSNALCYMKDGIQVLKNFPYFNNYDVVIDEETAYVLSSAGIYVVNVEELCAGEELRYRLYSINEGLESGLIANSWNYLAEDGTLYFCCNNGVTKFYGKQDNSALDYKCGVTSVLCDGEEIRCEEGIYYLPQGAKRVVVSASVRNYALADVKARFYVEGMENEPQFYSYKELEPIQLSNLDGGSYRIHFELADGSGDKILAEKDYTLMKEMQVWEHLWYKLYLAFVCVEVIAFATWTVIIMVNNSRRKEQLEKLRKELEEKVSEQTEEILLQQEKTGELFTQTVTALSEAVDAKDHYTSGHSRRVAEYAMMLAKRMGKSEEEQAEIYRAGMLHDVGKIRIPEDVINKPGKLTEEEFELIKIHPVTGYHILKGISGSRMIAQGAKSHHERYDGKGYPSGLQGENIPEIARIIGVADAYDAMASNRSYRKALPQETVRSEIERGRGTQFDPAIADIMLKMMDEDKEYAMKQKAESQKAILVADDESFNIETVKSIMKEETIYRITGAPGGREALEILKEQEIDLILLDVEMPGMDGFETLAHIREMSPVPVVLMTAEKSIETIQRVTEVGVDDYLTKPFLPIALKEVIHSILNG